VRYFTIGVISTGCNKDQKGVLQYNNKKYSLQLV